MHRQCQHRPLILQQLSVHHGLSSCSGPLFALLRPPTLTQPARPLPDCRYVLWTRIDQKTCLKAITAAGYEVVVVPPRREGDQLVTDVAALEQHLAALGAAAIAAMVTTTSCFAPRAADDVVAVARLCAGAGVAHIVNNAYGVQSAALCAEIASAWRKGRVDAVVQVSALPASRLLALPVPLPWGWRMWTALPAQGAREPL